MANWYEGTFNFNAGNCGIALTGMDFDVGTTYFYSFTVASNDPGTPYAGSFGIQKICSSPLGHAPAEGILKHSPDGGIGAHSGSGSFVAGANAAGTDLHYAVATMAMGPGYVGTCSFVINPEGWVGGDPPPTPPPDPPEVIITDPDLTPLDTLTDLNKWMVRVELKDVGSGALIINRHSAEASEAVLRQGNWVQVVIPRIWDQPIALWQLENAEIVLLDASGEEGKEDIGWNGRGGLSYAARSIAWNESFVVPGPKDTVGILYGPASTGGKAGQLLHRWVHEATHANRGVTDWGVAHAPLGLMTHDFDYDLDSNGDPWVVTPSTAELGSGVIGENGLYSVSKLVAIETLDAIMFPNMLLRAFNHYGRDLTGDDFGAGVVRFVRGINIAGRAVRQYGPELPPTHVLVQGDLPAYGYARAADFASRPTVEAFVRTHGSDPDFLEEVGLSEISRRLRSGESVSFKVDIPMPLEEDELTGKYLPGPPGSNGHFWIGDTVTLHIGDGSTYGDVVNEDVRIHAITLEHDDANNLACTVEVKWVRLLGRQGPRAVGSGSLAPPTTSGGVVPVPPPAASTAHGHDHGALSGLGDNDHPQYTTDAEVEAIIAAASIADLADVSDTAPSDGDAYIFDSGSGLWVPTAIGSGVTLSDDTPLVESGSGSAGTSGEASRSDHVHPDDGGGGGGGVQLSGLDRAPASPHAKDDEFEGGSLDAKWTIPASSGAGQEVTATLENGVVAITPTTSGSASTGKRFFGISQAAPSGSFSVRAKLGEAGQGTDRRHGLYVAVAGSTGHIIGPFAQDNRIAARGVTTTSTTGDWSAVDGFSILSALMPTVSWPFPAWVRIDWDAGTSVLSFFASLHGLIWVPIGTRSSMSQPSTFGICLYSNGATVRADDVLAADWVRVVE